MNFKCVHCSQSIWVGFFFRMKKEKKKEAYMVISSSGYPVFRTKKLIWCHCSFNALLPIWLHSEITCGALIVIPSQVLNVSLFTFAALMSV